MGNSSFIILIANFAKSDTMILMHYERICACPHISDVIFVKKITHIFVIFTIRILMKLKGILRNHILCVIKVCVLKGDCKTYLYQNQPLKITLIEFTTRSKEKIWIWWMFYYFKTQNKRNKLNGMGSGKIWVNSFQDVKNIMN